MTNGSAALVTGAIGIWFGWTIAQGIKGGTMPFFHAGLSSVERSEHPVGFWVLTTFNASIVLMCAVGAIGMLIEGPGQPLR